MNGIGEVWLPVNDYVRFLLTNLQKKAVETVKKNRSNLQKIKFTGAPLEVEVYLETVSVLF